MKRILFAIAVTCLIPSSDAVVFAFDVLEIKSKYQENQWWSGKNLAEGDYFVYEICHSESFTKSTLSGHCYDISLEFVALLQTETGRKWIVQVQILTTDGEQKYAIFQIDADTFDITTDRTSIEHAGSVRDSIFHMNQYANNAMQKSLNVGQGWGQVPSYITPDPQMTVRERSVFPVQGMQIPVFSVGYAILEKTSFLISPDMPFPVSATAYDPNRIIPDTHMIFRYDLLMYGNAGTIDAPADIFEEGFLDAVRQNSLEFELQRIGQNPSGIQNANQEDAVGAIQAGMNVP